MRILYEAYDGKIFTDEEECLIYEEKNTFKLMKNIIFFDGNENEYYVSLEDLWDDKNYNSAEAVSIPTKEAYEIFHKWSVEGGWSEFEQIDEPGYWKRTLPYENDIYGGVWVKFE